MAEIFRQRAPSPHEVMVLPKIPGLRMPFGEVAIYPLKNTCWIADARLHLGEQELTATYIGTTERDGLIKVAQSKGRFIIGPIIAGEPLPRNAKTQVLVEIKFGDDIRYILESGGKIKKWGLWDTLMNPYNLFSQRDFLARKEQINHVKKLENELARAETKSDHYERLLESRDYQIESISLDLINLRLSYSALQHRFDELRKEKRPERKNSFQDDLFLFGFTERTFTSLTPVEIETILLNLKRGIYSGLHPDRLLDTKLKNVTQEALKEANAALERIAKRLDIEL